MLNNIWKTRILVLCLGVLGAGAVYGANTYYSNKERLEREETNRRKTKTILASHYAKEKNSAALGDLQALFNCQNNVRLHGITDESLTFLVKFIANPKKDRTLRQRALSTLIKPLRNNQIKMRTPEILQVQKLYLGLLKDKQWSMRFGGLAFLAGFRDKSERPLVEEMMKSDPDKRIKDYASTVLHTVKWD
jgi:hypothetical protein